MIDIRHTSMSDYIPMPCIQKPDLKILIWKGRNILISVDIFDIETNRLIALPR